MAFGGGSAFISVIINAKMSKSSDVIVWLYVTLQK